MPFILRFRLFLAQKALFLQNAEQHDRHDERNREKHDSKNREHPREIAHTLRVLFNINPPDILRIIVDPDGLANEQIRRARIVGDILQRFSVDGVSYITTKMVIHLSRHRKTNKKGK